MSSAEFKVFPSGENVASGKENAPAHKSLLNKMVALGAVVMVASSFVGCSPYTSEEQKTAVEKMSVETKDSLRYEFDKQALDNMSLIVPCGIGDGIEKTKQDMAAQNAANAPFVNYYADSSLAMEHGKHFGKGFLAGASVGSTLTFRGHVSEELSALAAFVGGTIGTQITQVGFVYDVHKGMHEHKKAVQQHVLAGKLKSGR